MQDLVLSVLAHVDAGKTTLSEAMLYLSGELRKLGRVDHRDSFLDHFDQERRRGITIFSKQARLSWKGQGITLLDTPGHADFSSETERALRAADCAVLVISGTDGVQAHTETLWNLLRRYQMPAVLFVSKMDSSHLSPGELMADLRQHLGEGCIDFTHSSVEERAEAAAMLDEDVLEEYMASGGVSDAAVTSLIAGRKLFPCFFGSGLKVEGVEEFLDALVRWAPRLPALPAFGARVFKIARDARGKRLTYLRVTGGTLSVRESVRYLPRGGAEAAEEKISEIRLYSGTKYESADAVSAGTVCAVLGLTGTRPGQGLGVEEDAAENLLEPVLGYRLILPKGTDARTMLPKLRELEEEDPQLHIHWQEDLGEIRLQLMGEVQIDVLKELIRERFDADVSIGSGRILYRETIADTVEGVGHYEPLRHYAEVHLLLEPLERGSGLVFDTACSTDALDLNWQRLVLTHLEEKQHLGVLTGSPITDLKITLVAGRAHPKHTEGGDFRQATYRAVRQGLMQAKSVLLEPVYDFRLEVPTAQIGRAITDLRARNGEFSSPEPEGDRSVLTGTAPVSAMAGYLTEVLAYTGGKGRLFCSPGGYRPCPTQDAVVAELGYDAESDLQNPPGSIFCAHGAGFHVKWNDVSQYMHLESALKKPAEAEPTPEAAAPTVRRAYSIDEKELEAIMEREFGPIRRKQYTAPTVNSAAAAKPWTLRKERLIVDGYNLLFAWDALKELSLTSIDAAREKLVDLMASYSAFRKAETVLVFDAYKVPGGQGERYDAAGLHIVYTKENESADLYIERLASEIGKNENVRVVTSDALIRLTALRSGVLRTSSREFRAEVEAALEEMRSAPYMEKDRSR